MIRCTCVQPGYCPHYGIHLVGRLWQIKEGIGIAPESRQQYLDLWERQATERGHNGRHRGDQSSALAARHHELGWGREIPAPHIVSREEGSLMQWSYGVTTVPKRKNELLLRTLVSLAAAGFPEPRLFVDGGTTADLEWYQRELGLPLTNHFPPLLTHGNWVTALHELFIRCPTAKRYAIFQDDVIACRGLKDYLERCPYPDKGYWNLITYPLNQILAPAGKDGWFHSNQRGFGAQGLCFSNEAVMVLLSTRALVERPKDVMRGTKYIDGGVVDAMKKSGYKEYCHNPSLVQHTGTISSMGNGPQPESPSFRGEEWDAMSVLDQSPIGEPRLGI